MPNWCSNVVIFEHADTTAIKRIVDAFKTGEFMQQFFPCPADLRDTTSGFSSDPEQQANLTERHNANTEKYGYPTWYEWMIDNWGVKWDVGVENDETVIYTPGDTSVTLNFDTAWNPPFEFYAKMVDELGYNVKAYYYEPGMAFCGLWNNGDNQDYKVPATSAEVADKIPSNIDEMFNITLFMQEYEEEVA